MSLHKRLFRWTMSVILLMGFTLTMGTQEGWAQGHDLVVRGVWADPSPLVCGSKVCARILAVGQMDYQFLSGQVRIRFYYRQVGGQTWNRIGEIRVVWEPWENGLVEGNFWPTESGTSNNNCITFSPPALGDYQFRAEIVLPTGIVDDNIGDNTSAWLGDSPLYQAGERCIEVSRCDFIPIASGWIASCPPKDRFIPRHFCQRYPELCEWDICKQFPQFCGPIDPCKLFPPCPWKGPIEVLFDDRINRLNFAVINGVGSIVAQAEKLRRPIREGNTTYTQRLQYVASPDEKYSFVFWPSKETKLDTSLPLPVLVRRGTPTKSGK